MKWLVSACYGLPTQGLRPPRWSWEVRATSGDLPLILLHVGHYLLHCLPLRCQGMLFGDKGCMMLGTARQS